VAPDLLADGDHVSAGQARRGAMQGLRRAAAWIRRQDNNGRDAPQQPARAAARTAILRVPRRLALAAIAILVAAASLVSFAESYRGLYVWALHHGLSGRWAGIWPLQVDVFIAVGELALFVALADRWAPRSRTAAWLVTLAGLAVSVAGNVGHVAGRSPVTVRATAAVPPLAAAAALAVGLGVLKRVVEAHHLAADVSGHDTRPDAVSSYVPTGAENAAMEALRATLAAGNPLSVNQLSSRFNLTRPAATRVRDRVLAETNGQHQEDAGEASPEN
jgi:Protein of unknown function (DUF2637)